MTKNEERENAIESLKALLKPGAIVNTILRGKPSASGMSRTIDLLIVVPRYDTIYQKKPNGMNDYDAPSKRKLVGHEIRSIGWTAAKAMGVKFNADKQGITVGGCGMDMGFSLVYDLGRTLWPKGTPKPHGRRNGEPDREGGYALKHRWI